MQSDLYRICSPPHTFSASRFTARGGGILDLHPAIGSLGSTVRAEALRHGACAGADRNSKTAGALLIAPRAGARIVARDQYQAARLITPDAVVGPK
jgi:hypothetical protein